MPSFTPPTELTTPPVSDDPIEIRRNPIGYALWRHYPNRACGRNVYIIDGTTVTEDEPIATYSDDGSIDQFPEERITRFFQGGGTYSVTAAEQALLEAEGYTVTP